MASRKVSTLETKVYEYGIPFVSPETEEIIYQEIKKTHNLRKKLVTIERNRRSRRRRILKFVAPELEKFEKEYENLSNQVKNIYITKLTGIEKKDRPPEIIDQLSKIKEKQSKLSEQIKKSREEAVKNNFSAMDKQKRNEIIQETLRVLTTMGKLPSWILCQTIDELKKNDNYEKWKKTIIEDHNAIKKEAKDQEDFKEKEAELFEAYRKAAQDARPSKWFKTVLLGPSNSQRHEVKKAINERYENLNDPNLRIWKLWDRIQLHAKNRSNIVKHACNIGSGTKNEVVKAAETSFAKTLFKPKYPAFDGTGLLAIQLTKDKGLVVEKLFGCQDPWLKIEKRPEIKLKRPTCAHCGKYFSHEAQGKAHCFNCGEILELARIAAVTRMKLHGTKNNAVYLDLPTVLHRPLPEDAVIKWAYLKVGRIGFRKFYRLQLVVESATFGQRPTFAEPKHIAVNFGWRVLRSKEIRVATFWDGENESYVILPAKMRQSSAFKEDLLSISDKLFNKEKDLLKNFIKENGISKELRQAFQKAPYSCWKTPNIQDLIDKEFHNMIFRHIIAWRDHKKLDQITKVMIDEFLPEARELEKQWNKYILAKPDHMTWSQWRKSLGGKTPDLMPKTFEKLCEWLKTKNITNKHQQLTMHLAIWSTKDRHLINWARGIESKLMLQRREIYRRAAYRLGSQYSHIILGEWNMSETARRSEKWSEPSHEANANAIRQLVGVSIFKECLKQRFGKEYSIKAETKRTSNPHFDCGGTFDKDEMRREIIVHCPKCKKHVDQDVNAAKAFYAKHCEGPGGGSKPGTARNPQNNPKKVAAA